MPEAAEAARSYVIPEHLAEAPLWERIEWLLEDMKADDLNAGIPRFVLRYTDREQQIAHLLGAGIERPKPSVARDYQAVVDLLAALPEVLLQTRTTRGMSYREVAAATGVAQSFVWRIEKRQADPTTAVAAKLLTWAGGGHA